MNVGDRLLFPWRDGTGRDDDGRKHELCAALCRMNSFWNMRASSFAFPLTASMFERVKEG